MYEFMQTETGWVVYWGPSPEVMPKREDRGELMPASVVVERTREVRIEVAPVSPA